jgi:methylthioribose-1-phosphate isomerase
MLETVRWLPLRQGKLLPGKLRLIDQTLLPGELNYVETDDLETIHDAIKRLVVRGAPAIGCAAALGLAAVCQHFSDSDSPMDFLESVRKTADFLATSRPTAVNLFWALNRCVARVEREVDSGDLSLIELKDVLVREGIDILEEDMRLCRRIGEQGVSVFGGRKGVGVLTHCNAGALATSDYGTALSPIYVAQERGLQPKVFADETRPLLQGARLTTWELMRSGVDVTLICDNMASQVMREGKIDVVITGADRIAANGDSANKIGTYGVAILAKHHGIPFYIAAPYSTIDVDIPDGAGIPIEQRRDEEVTCGFGRRTAPDGVTVYNPAFDVTPAALITGIITEQGILEPPFDRAIQKLFAG